MSNDRIVAVGLLTEQDLDVLGTGFRRHFPVKDDGMFDDLLMQLDKVEVESSDRTIVLRPGASDR